MPALNPTVLILMLGASAASAVRADSIWQRAEPGHAFLFIDTKARCPGDLITVLITETTNVDLQDDRSMNKQTAASEGFSLAGKATGGLGQQASTAALDVKNQSARDFQGGASFRSDREFSDRFTVQVMDVLPNGNLVISGKRRVQIAGEEATLVLSGVVRAIDIGPDNTLQSRYISELRLNYESEGASKSFTRQGRLGRIGNRVWPF